MNAETYLSRLLLVLSLAAVLTLTVLLPQVLTHHQAGPDEVQLASFRSMLDKSGGIFPTPTVAAIWFTDHWIPRLALLGLLAVAGIAVEKGVANRKVSGFYHAVVLSVAALAGALFLLACILPLMPL